MATISFHNEGDKARRSHNIRDKKVIEKEPHIDPNGIHEIWIDETPRDTYHRLFDESLAEYNVRQTRPERKIRSYYNHIAKDGKKHILYEVVISVGSLRNPIDPIIGKHILREFIDDWPKRNPNLELIGAYYHADEEGVPHVHADYIPVAHGYTNGMRTQTGLVRAYKEMGLEKQGKLTAQIQWEKRECDVLERICNTHGIQVEHPLEENREHIRTEDYKIRQELKRVTKEKEEALIQAESARSSALLAERKAKEAEKEKAEVQKKLSDTKVSLASEVIKTEEARRKAENAKEQANKAEKEAENAKAETEKIKERYSRTAEAFNKLVRTYNTLLTAAKKLGLKVDQQKVWKEQEISR